MRYTVQIEPSRPEATAALLPQSAPAGSGKALFWGGANIVGGPSQTYPSPRPAALRDDSWGGQYQCSGNAPDMGVRGIQYVVPDNRWSHVRTVSNNEMPVPAGTPGNMAGVAMQAPIVGGRFQVAQPQPVTVWPDLNNPQAQDPGGGLGNAGWRYSGLGS